MAAACALVALVSLGWSTSASLPRRDECAALREGNSRVLLLYNTDKPALLAMYHGFAEAGWDVGLVLRRCTRLAEDMTFCPLDTLERRNPERLAYLRNLRAPMKPTDLIDALADFEPSLVVPDSAPTMEMLVETARRYENSTWPEEQRAVRALRCSLPRHREHWSAVTRKSALFALAARSGVRVPRSVRVPAEGLSGTRLETALALAPAVVKSDTDAGGRGVQICDDRACVRDALAELERARAPCTVQEYVRGVNTAYTAVFVDGQMVAGYARAKVSTIGAKGISLGSVTLNDADAAEGLAKLARVLGYTGIGASDFRVDGEGRAFMTDPNMRANTNPIVEGGALGIGEGLLLRLRRTLAEGARPQGPLTLPHSLTYMRFFPNHHENGLLDFALCADVYVPVPWSAIRWVPLTGKPALGLRTADCEIFDRRDERRLRVRQMCTGAGGEHARCAGKCKPLRVRRPAYTPADLAALCDRDGAWRAEHTNCWRHLPTPARSGRPVAEGLMNVTVGGSITFCEVN